MALAISRDTATIPELFELAQQLRIDSIRASTAAGSGHPTSALSAAGLMAVLLSKHLAYDFDDPRNPNNDHLIFSKGHASPLLYAMYKAAGAITDQELLTFRAFGSRLQGHPTPALPWVDVATGSLGQGLPIGVGIALAGKYLEQRPYHVWVLCGDSELAEGSIWEALDKASYYHLSNLTALWDINRLGQRGETALGWDLETYRRRAEAFGWHAQVVDGHHLAAMDEAFAIARAVTDKPTVIIAKTVKGWGVQRTRGQGRLAWPGAPARAGGPGDRRVGRQPRRAGAAGKASASGNCRHRGTCRGRVTELRSRRADGDSQSLRRRARRAWRPRRRRRPGR